MGNNNTNTTSGETYTSLVGSHIPLEGYSKSFLESLDHKLNTWLEGFSSYPLEDMNSEETEYLLDHLSSTTDPLMRVENGSYFLNSGLSVGDTLNGNQLFRSFGRTPDATLHMLEVKDRVFEDKNWVIYRTNGEVPFFDPTVFSNPFPHQEETFVPLDTMKITNIQNFSPNEINELTKELHFNKVPDVVNNVTVVDVEYDPSVTKVEVGQSVLHPQKEVFSTRNLLSPKSRVDLTKIPRRVL